MSDLKTTLENESNVAITWLKQNSMLANPKKFQVLFLSRNERLMPSTELNINENTIKSSKWVKLLRVKLDNRLNFELNVSDLFKSAARQPNVLLRLKPFLTFESKKVLIESFVYSNFNYCPLVWHFTSAK